MDQSLFAAPHGLSQRTTSFIASQRQGIHQMPLLHLIALIIDIRPSAETGYRSDHPRSQRGSCMIEKTIACFGIRSTTARTRRQLTPSPYTRHEGSTGSTLHDVRQPAAIRSIAAKQISRTKTAQPASRGSHRNGGARRDRTDDLMLAKHALSQLSYGPEETACEWWAWEDLNFRPHAYQARALTN